MCDATKGEGNLQLFFSSSVFLVMVGMNASRKQGCIEREGSKAQNEVTCEEKLVASTSINGGTRSRARELERRERERARCKQTLRGEGRSREGPSMRCCRLRHCAASDARLRDSHGAAQPCLRTLLAHRRRRRREASICSSRGRVSSRSSAGRSVMVDKSNPDGQSTFCRANKAKEGGGQGKLTR